MKCIMIKAESEEAVTIARCLEGSMCYDSVPPSLEAGILHPLTVIKGDNCDMGRFLARWATNTVVIPFDRIMFDPYTAFRWSGVPDGYFKIPVMSHSVFGYIIKIQYNSWSGRTHAYIGNQNKDFYIEDITLDVPSCLKVKGISVVSVGSEEEFDTSFFAKMVAGMDLGTDFDGDAGSMTPFFKNRNNTAYSLPPGAYRSDDPGTTRIRSTPSSPGSWIQKAYTSGMRAADEASRARLVCVDEPGSVMRNFEQSFGGMFTGDPTAIWPENTPTSAAIMNTLRTIVGGELRAPDTGVVNTVYNNT